MITVTVYLAFSKPPLKCVFIWYGTYKPKGVASRNLLGDGTGTGKGKGTENGSFTKFKGEFGMSPSNQTEMGNDNC